MTANGRGGERPWLAELSQHDSLPGDRDLAAADNSGAGLLLQVSSTAKLLNTSIILLLETFQEWNKMRPYVK